MTTPAVEILARDVICRKCEYNLRGLSADAHCPECGAPVAMSLLPDGLEYADPAFLRIMRLGCWLLFFDAVAPLVQRFPLWFFHSASIYNFFMMVGMVRLAARVGWGIGIWRTTTPEPGMDGPRNRSRFTRVRIFATVATVYFAVSYFGVLQVPLQGSDPAMFWIKMMLSFLMSTLIIIANWSVLSRMIQLATRWRPSNFARWTRITRWIYLSIFIVQTLLYLAFAVLFRQYGTRVTGSLGNWYIAYSATASIAMIVMSIVLGLLYWRLAGMFNKALRAALLTRTA